MTEIRSQKQKLLQKIEKTYLQTIDVIEQFQWCIFRQMIARQIQHF